MTRIGATLALAAAVSLFALPAHAQSLNTGANGQYGQVRLNANFEPDPHNASVQAGGEIDASTVSDNCVGFVARRASFSLRYRAGDLPLYIGAVSDSDTTILVRTPSGEYLCDDDSGGNLNPLVHIENPTNGRYQIWVGRYGVENEQVAANVHISEVSGPYVEPAQAGPDFSLDPAYGVADLVSGFEPDPHQQEIAAGGGIDMGALGVEGCVGWIAQAPDYRVNFTAGENGYPLIFSVLSEADTVLVINDAEGNWVCNDDTDGFNPKVVFATPVSGQYDIWVGTYSEGDLQQSVLSVSEIAQ
ncbi:MAG: hypothetical protein AB7Q23_05490 [Hyphomonadaceae bacterium]